MKYRISVAIFEIFINLIQQNAFKHNSNFKNRKYLILFYLKRYIEHAHVLDAPPLLDIGTHNELQGMI